MQNFRPTVWLDPLGGENPKQRTLLEYQKTINCPQYSSLAIAMEFGISLGSPKLYNLAFCLGALHDGYDRCLLLFLLFGDWGTMSLVICM